MDKDQTKDRVRRKRAGLVIGGPILLVLAILLSPLLLIGFIFYFLSGLFLYLAIWLNWNKNGRDILIVYSDSPIWSGYFENEILPILEHRSIILNWSERKLWKKSLATFAFYRFGGSRNFNPLIVVFKQLRPAKVFRFFKPFQDFKHGNPEKVEQMKLRLIEELHETGRKS